MTLQEVDRAVERAILALRRLPYAEYLLSSHWQRVRELALERAGHQCELCAHADGLEIHHRTYERLGFERPGDVIALCHDCHRDFHRSLLLRAIRATEHAPLGVTVADVLEKVS
ncbi:MAG TPA: hypothetical protein VG871_04220 [Vicinamibacterales bacterium]|nr:hypothetical protein [Vicinamibacterales bacterium]